MAYGNQPNFTCTICGKTIHLADSLIKANRKYCSHACQVKGCVGMDSPTWKGGLQECICLNCGNKFMQKPSRIKKGGGRFCSYDCSYAYRRGKPNLKLQKRVTKYCVVCGKEIVVTKEHSKSQGTYCSKKCLGLGYQTSLLGPKNPNWRGGEEAIICKNCGQPFIVQHTFIKQRIFCSDSCRSAWNVIYRKNQNGRRSKVGKREDLNGLFVRSSWEANYARYLNYLIETHEIINWDYEIDKFIITNWAGKQKFYIPDFKIIKTDMSIEYHEVKGYMDKDSQYKLDKMNTEHPDVKLILVNKQSYRQLETQYKDIIPKWECMIRKSRSKTA
jgi:hypothetical protein